MDAAKRRCFNIADTDEGEIIIDKGNHDMEKPAHKIPDWAKRYIFKTNYKDMTRRFGV